MQLRGSRHYPGSRGLTRARIRTLYTVQAHVRGALGGVACALNSYRNPGELLNRVVLTIKYVVHIEPPAVDCSRLAVAPTPRYWGSSGELGRRDQRHGI